MVQLPGLDAQMMTSVHWALITAWTVPVTVNASTHPVPSAVSVRTVTLEMGLPPVQIPMNVQVPMIVIQVELPAPIPSGVTPVLVKLVSQGMVLLVQMTMNVLWVPITA
jgi:hypothetical protein